MLSEHYYLKGSVCNSRIPGRETHLKIKGIDALLHLNLSVREEWGFRLLAKTPSS